MRTFAISILVALGLANQAEVVGLDVSYSLPANSSTDEDYEHWTQYLLVKIHGFNVYVSGRAMEERPETTEQALWVLRAQISHARDTLPDDAYKRTTGTKVFLNDETHGTPEDDISEVRCYWACYVVREVEGMNPAFEESIVFRNMDELIRLTWCCSSVFMHELAHAYHHKQLDDGFRNLDVRRAYGIARVSGEYDSVKSLWHTVEDDQAYAMTDEGEYFAELTTKFYYYSDEYPFNNRDLHEVDEGGWRMVSDAWHRRGDFAPNSFLFSQSPLQNEMEVHTVGRHFVGD